MLYKILRMHILALLLLPVLANAQSINDLNSKLPTNGIAKTFISGQTFNRKQVTYEKINGLAIVEGDIVIGTVAEAIRNASTAKSIILNRVTNRWPNRVIVYDFGPNFTVATQNMINQAIDHWRANTTLQFVLRTTVNAAQFPNFVTFVDDQVACFSSIGMTGGQQFINAHSACGVGATIHEIGHAIGLWHEQSRADRDQFVTINTANITIGKEHNFNQHIVDGIDVGTYDYDSIMHYGEFAFSNNGLATIVPLQTGVTIGQRVGLSTLDIASILQHYPDVLAPIARLDKTHYDVYYNSYAQFDASSSSSSSGLALTYSFSTDNWFHTSNSPTVRYLYTQLGNHKVTLTVTDSFGNTATTSATVTLLPYELPVAKIGITGTTIVTGKTTYFDASSSTGTNLSYFWDRGDGTTFSSSQATMNYKYSNPGNYIVSLTVTDVKGISSTTSKSISIISNSLVARLDRPYYIEYIDSWGSAWVYFDGAMSSSTVGSTLTYTFEFSDGQVRRSSSPYISRTFRFAGRYGVKLTVSAANGLSSTTSAQIDIRTRFR